MVHHYALRATEIKHDCDDFCHYYLPRANKNIPSSLFAEAFSLFHMHPLHDDWAF